MFGKVVGRSVGHAAERRALVPWPRPAISTTFDHVHADHQGLIVLDEASCRGLLHTVRLGRVALTDGALPMILPLTFACLDRDLVFRAGPGALQRAALARQVVCFEADWVDERVTAGWSVSAIGHLRAVTDPAHVERCNAAALPTWSNAAISGSADDSTFVVLTPELFSGRQRCVPVMSGN